MENDFILKFRTSIMAGIAISIGCIAYLSVGGIIGAVLFSFGLLTVTHYSLLLYTGKVGFLELVPVCRRDIIVRGYAHNYPYSHNWLSLCTIILGNMIGCALVAVLASYSSLPISAAAIFASRMELPWYSVIIRAIGCGFIMTTAVRFARERQYLPLLFGVPLFIMCGFLHSIADSFYYFFGGAWSLHAAEWLGLTYFGNYLGCKAFRLFTKDS